VNAATGPIVAPRELFRSDNLLVRQVAGFGSDVCYVTFASYTDDRRLDRPGFGEEHFTGRGIDAIHVLSRDNRWYQHPELDEALRAVAGAVAGYVRVIAYGSSMGGLVAMLAMLNSCASNISVVNIDNGFGAAYSAGLVWTGIEREKRRMAETEKR